MRKCSFIHASKKSTALPSPVFTKLTNIQQLYVQFPNTKISQKSDSKCVKVRIEIPLGRLENCGFH